MNELNLTPTETLILIPILFYLVWKLWRYESLIELDISPRIDEVEEKTPLTTYKSATVLIYSLPTSIITRRAEHGNIFS